MWSQTLIFPMPFLSAQSQSRFPSQGPFRFFKFIFVFSIRQEFCAMQSSTVLQPGMVLTVSLLCLTVTFWSAEIVRTIFFHQYWYLLSNIIQLEFFSRLLLSAQTVLDSAKETRVPPAYISSDNTKHHPYKIPLNTKHKKTAKEKQACWRTSTCSALKQTLACCRERMEYRTRWQMVVGSERLGIYSLIRVKHWYFINRVLFKPSYSCNLF